MKRRKLFIFLFFLICGVVLSFSHIGVHIVGDSMEPTIANGSRVVAVKANRVQRFDVISFAAPDNPDENYIKRIVGMPGDVIEFKHGVLFLSGQAIDEKYLATADGKMHTADFSLYESIGQLTVPADTVFVLGDNRNDSNDSRYFGFVEKSAIESRATFIYWPPSEMRFINSNYTLIDDEHYF